MLETLLPPKNRVSHLAKYEDYYIHNTTAQK